VNRFERKLPVAYLKPGEMYFAEQSTLIVTVLGSCVSITMFSRRAGLGAICHGLLTRCKGQLQCGGDCLDGFKYVDCSIRRMAALFYRRGVRREIEVKRIGGADMYYRDINKREAVSDGNQNLTIAQQVLASEGLSLKVSDVGGMRGRKILFYTDTGDVFLKRLTKVNDPDIKW
jgi:chemotaxis protein CheD